MIVPNLQGGLGNQLFQVANAFAYALRNNADFGINYYLNHTAHQGNSPLTYQNNFFRKLSITTEIPLIAYQEKEWKFTGMPTGSKDLLIEGYFQSEKNFIDYKQIIKDIFTIDKDVHLLKVDSLLGNIKKKKVGIHIRRGDYYNYQHIFNILDRNYYNNALSFFNRDEYEIILCSDNKANIKEIYGIENYLTLNSVNEIVDFYLLSQCDSIIMSNSSFSWWSTYLGKDKEKIICPAIWFAKDGPKDWQDIYLDNWIKV